MDILTTLNLSPTQTPSLPANLRSRLINFLIRWKHNDAALACLDILQRDRPELVSLYDARARTLLAMGRPDDALQVMIERHKRKQSLTSRVLVARVHLARSHPGTALNLAKELVAELEVRVGDPGLNCSTCHPVATSVEKLVDIRMSAPDYDGDGDTTEGIAGEIGTMADRLLTEMQAYADANPDTDPIVYNPDAYPYFFNDAGARYATWTPRLLRGAYIYQYVQKDPGGFAHNAKYIIQVLYDALVDFGVDVSSMTRP